MDIAIFKLFFVVVWIVCGLCVAHCNPSCVGVGVGCFKFKIWLWGCLCVHMALRTHLAHDLSKLGFNSPFWYFSLINELSFLLTFSWDVDAQIFIIENLMIQVAN
jgi:uncharacterized membrane protein